MTKLRLLFLTIFISLIVFSYPKAAFAGNIVTNPGFDSDFTGWNTWDGGAGTVVSIDSACHTGSKCTKFTGYGSVFQGRVLGQNWYTYPTALQGVWMQYSFWVRGSAAGTGQFVVTPRSSSFVDTGYVPGYMPFTGSTTWKRVSGFFNLPSSYIDSSSVSRTVTGFDFSVMPNNNNGGAFWVDDVSIEPAVVANPYGSIIYGGGNGIGVVGHNGSLTIGSATDVSIKKWKTQTAPPAWINTYNYTYWKTLLAGKLPGTPGSDPIPSGSATNYIQNLATNPVNYVYLNGLTINTPQNFDSPNSVVFVIEGNLNINAPIRRLNKKSFLGFFVQGTITVGPGVDSSSLKDGLVSYWRFDSDFNDFGTGSGNNNGSSTGVTLATVNGKIANGGNFNGASYVTVPDNGTIWAKKNYTISAWFNPSNTTGFKTIVGKDNNYWLRIDNDSIVGVPRVACFTNLYNGTTYNWQQRAVSVSAPPINVWQHAVCTYDGANLKLYVNGILQQSTPVALGSNTMGNNSGMQIGSINSWVGGTFAGSLDEVGFWGRTLSANDVLQLYTQTANSFVTTPPTPVAAVEGFYFANGTITFNGGDKQFIGGGSFIGLGGVVMNRNLGNDSSGGNPALPAEKFYFDPSLVINAPTDLMKSTYSWKEVAP